MSGVSVRYCLGEKNFFKVCQENKVVLMMMENFHVSISTDFLTKGSLFKRIPNLLQRKILLAGQCREHRSPAYPLTQLSDRRWLFHGKAATARVVERTLTAEDVEKTGGKGMPVSKGV